MVAIKRALERTKAESEERGELHGRLQTPADIVEDHRGLMEESIFVARKKAEPVLLLSPPGTVQPTTRD